MFKRVFSMILVAVMLGITSIGCVATTEHSGYGHGRYRSRNRGDHTTTVGVTNTGAAVIGGVLGLLLIRDLVWGPPQAVTVQPGQQYVPTVSPECEQYLGNERALASCERGVARRRIEEQKRLEREAFEAGRGR